MESLADIVLSLVRNRADLSRWGAANAHGRQMHEAIDLLENALDDTDPVEAHAVVQAALASAVKVIARADDSSGIIGQACRRLLDLHPMTALAANVSPAKLVDWMIKFQFDGEVDYFEIDPVAYAPALGVKGMARYRSRLDAVRAGLAPVPADAQTWQVPDRHERWVLDWNDRRLAVLDRDVEAIIRTHARDRKVAAWFHDTASAFEEIGDLDRAVDWARQATEFDAGHQSLRAADYWCDLLAQYRPAEELSARHDVFHRWPSATTASRLHAAAGNAWPDYSDDVLVALAHRPAEAVKFAIHSLGDPQLGWELGERLPIDDDHAWAELAKAYELVDPAAVLPVHRRLVEHELANTGAEHYRRAARRLAGMRKLAAGTSQQASVDRFIVELRETHRKRPRLQQEFDRARLPTTVDVELTAEAQRLGLDY